MMNREQRILGTLTAALLALCTAAGTASPQSQEDTIFLDEQNLVQLDFTNADLTDIIDAISEMTHTNFIYDERVRGKVTIKSPTKITPEQAYAVFESVLQIKGFTTVETPGGALKVIPLRDAKETNVETLRTGLAPPNMDRYVTRLIPLRVVDAASIINTLKPLVSKDASISAYEPTNTVILTESASNIRRILAILEAIDIELFQEELAILKVEYADASTLASQISEIYAAEVSSSSAASSRSTSSSSRRTSSRSKPATTSASGKFLRDPVRIITDDRTNSLIILGARAQLDDVRDLVARLDVPVTGGGRIHVYYLQHADSEELAKTLGALVGGASGSAAKGGASGAAQALRSSVSGLAGQMTITADPTTNALVIQASKEGYDTLRGVIEKLDVERPQVLVEALIMEVDVTDSETLGFAGMLRIVNGDTNIGVGIAPIVKGMAEGAALGGPPGAVAGGGIPFLQRFFRDSLDEAGNGSVIDSIIHAAASDTGTNIISAPHILTMDNEQAEIRIGANIPIITNRVQSAQGTQGSTLATSVSVERQDIGVTLRVTPQITEGDSLRLEIFQELSSINEGLAVGDANNVGVPLSNTEIENVVVVKDGETVVIGGLLKDEYQDTISKVPFLSDIPVLGWAFKSTQRKLTKTNLLIFLTPYIIRSPEDLEFETIRKREEFAEQSQEGLKWSDRERAAEKKRQERAAEAGELYQPRGDNPVRISVLEHEARYPLERAAEIESEKQRMRDLAEAERETAQRAPRFAVQAALWGGPRDAVDALQQVLDAGYEGMLLSSESAGTLLFELRIGPYATLEEAEQVSAVVRHSHGLSPSVVVVPAEDRELP